MKINAGDVKNPQTGRRSVGKMVEKWKGDQRFANLNPSRIGLRTTEAALQHDYDPIPGDLVVQIVTAEGIYASAAVANAIAMLGPGFEPLLKDRQIKFIPQETDVTKAVGEMYKAREAALRKA